MLLRGGLLARTTPTVSVITKPTSSFPSSSSTSCSSSSSSSSPWQMRIRVSLQHVPLFPVKISPSPLHFSQYGARWFHCSTKACRARQHNRSRMHDFKSKVESDESLPLFPTLLRNFYKKVHPDLLRAQSPMEAEVNDSSMKELNGVLSSIKVYNEHPPAMVKNIAFYVKGSSGGSGLTKVNLQLKTAGGDCKRSLMRTFQDFFSRTGVHTGPFSWGHEYFPSGPKNNGGD